MGRDWVWIFFFCINLSCFDICLNVVFVSFVVVQLLLSEINVVSNNPVVLSLSGQLTVKQHREQRWSQSNCCSVPELCLPLAASVWLRVECCMLAGAECYRRVIRRGRVELCPTYERWYRLDRRRGSCVVACLPPSTQPSTKDCYSGMAEKVARANAKRAVTRQVNVIRQCIATDKLENIDNDVEKLKSLFISFEQAVSSYQLTLESDEDIDMVRHTLMKSRKNSSKY